PQTVVLVHNHHQQMFAAFIDINEKKNAFLYAGDIIPESAIPEGEQIEEKLTPAMICDIIRKGQDIMVQIEKEPVGTKGARASTHISLPGRTLVFMPTVDVLGISKRITAEGERKRLKDIINEVRPEGTGVIVRTAAQELDSDEIKQDLLNLVEEWRRIQKRFEKCSAPALIHKEDSLVFRTVRDVFKKDVRRLVVNDRAHFELIKSLVPEEFASRVELYDEPYDMFEAFGAEQALDAALSRKVWLKSGAYIVIDQTEALTSIDVNTGKYVGNVSLERTIVETNKEAAMEIARQLRLRDIGGIIIIDFIDMEKESDRRAVLNTLRNVLHEDRTRSHVFGFTHLGLVEMTRKKTGRSIGDTVQMICPYCNGDARVLSPESMVDRVRKQTMQVLRGSTNKRMLIDANPEVVDALERAEKRKGNLFPPEMGGTYFAHPNPSLHIEKFTVRPLAEKKIVEAKKECKIIH
ncbi:MAG: Rne/Rng family ribonuclease, partial [Clostridia bacterium]|nr:Rne/Rng family ribonuclease [Clostridia bacterium]